MVETQKKMFANWTEYDKWLVENYSEFSVFNLNEKSGAVNAEFCKKSDFQALLAEQKKA